MAEKEEGEDIEDLLMKNIYNEKEIEKYTGIKTYKSIDYISTKNYYKDKFNKGISKELIFHKKRIYSMDWLNNNSGTILVTGSSDNYIKIWDLNVVLNSSNKSSSYSLNPHLSINSHNETINNIASRSNQDNQFICSTLDKHIKFFDIRNSSPNDIKAKEEIKHLKFNNSGTQFAFITKDGNLYLYDFGKSEEIQKFSFKSLVYDFVFNKEDDKIFLTSEDGNVILINIKLSNNNKINITGSSFPLNTIDIDKKNKYFITGGTDGILISYNVEELMSCKTYKRSDQGIRQIMYNYDDRFIATIYDGKNIDFFSTELDDHIYTIFTNNNQHFFKWNKKRNILAYVSDDKKGEDMKNKKTDEGKFGIEGCAHFFILPNL